MEKETLIQICAVLMFIKVAAVAQVPFELVCPEAGFRENDVYTLECTVRGSGVKGATCFSTVTSVRLETVEGSLAKSIARSPFPTCDNNWSSVNNENGRCADRDTYTDVYTYQFNVTADRGRLTNITGLRCFSECSSGPGKGNPFTFKSSETCGPPVIFVAPEPSTTPGHKSISDNTSATPTDTETHSPGTLGIGLGVAGGVLVVMAAVCSGVFCIRKQRSGGQQNASPAIALPANALPANDPPANASPHNAHPAAGSAGPSSGQTVPTTPDAEPYESSVAGSEASEASEASEGAEDSASDVSEV